MKIGIIGGSGLNDPDILRNPTEKRVLTPYGEPSDALICGDIEGVPCVILARHGRKHTIYPSKVPYRANLWALKEEGCTHVIASTACGGLQEHNKPGDFLVLDQFIDRTHNRVQTFYDGEPGHLEGVLHIPMAEPYCEATRKVVIEACHEYNNELKTASEGANELRIHEHGCVLTIEGPRFSSRQESKLWKSWGADVINMTSVPEVVLAKELGLSYSAVAMVTDYDSWHPQEANVTVSQVLQTFKKNSQHLKNIFLKTIPKLATHDWSAVIAQNQEIVRGSRQDLISQEHK